MSDFAGLDEASIKTFLFQRATTSEQKGDYNASFEDLTRLIKIDPHNNDAIAAARRVKEILMSQRKEATEVQKLLKVISENAGSKKDALGALIEACTDNTSNALDFGRKGGLSVILKLLNDNLTETVPLTTDNLDIASRCFRLLMVTTANTQFVSQFYRPDGFYDGDDSSRFRLTLDGRLSILLLCQLLLASQQEMILITPALATLVNLLKASPVSDEITSVEKKKLIQENTIKLDDPVTMMFPMEEIRRVFQTILSIATAQVVEVHTLLTDFLGALCSSNINYFDANADVDLRTESLQDRRVRLRVDRIVASRVSSICRLAIKENLITQLVNDLVSPNILIRRSSSSLLGRFIKQYNQDEAIKGLLLPFLPGEEDNSVSDTQSNQESKVIEIRPLLTGTMAEYLRRAALEASLLSTHPDLGAWALEQRNGAANLLRLVSLGDPACVEIAAEVICLAASVEALAQLMSFLVEKGVLHTLVSSAIPGVCAAAASALTKLAIKSKALHQNADENSLILNAVLSVLKSSSSSSSSSSNKGGKSKTGATAKSSSSSAAAASASSLSTVSFSAHDLTGSSSSQHIHGSSSSSSSSMVGNATQEASSHATTMTSVERSVEVLAAMVGHTFVKEELVHGSYRVSPCMKEILSLDIDHRSTLGYGIAHIVSQLTVTNKELKALALAEKEMTVEQYEQLQELQRIKTTDEQGNVVEEKKDEVDVDTSEMCKQRIRKLVSQGAIKCLTKLSAHVSAATREKALLSLRQICTDEMSRGTFIQEGGFKLCCELAVSHTESAALRREAAHAVAKALVTTNPHVMSEHQRLGAMRPLLYLCKESGTTQLQQFEALLSLTNLLSCGMAEQNRFASEKGVHAVHYLMFSSNLMVRRAATEAFCNLSQHDDFLKILQDREKLRLWLALIEDWDPAGEDKTEKFLTARAALGTLAVAAGDEKVALALVQEDCGKTIQQVLRQEHEELIHRVLVLINQLLSHEESSVQIANHLAQFNIIPALSVAAKFKNPEFGELLSSIVEVMTYLLS